MAKQKTKKRLSTALAVAVALVVAAAAVAPLLLHAGTMRVAQNMLATAVYKRRDTKPNDPAGLGTLWGTPAQGRDYALFNSAMEWYWEKLESGAVETWRQTATQVAPAGQGAQPIELVAHYLPNEVPTAKTAIIAHGFNVNPRDLGGWIKLYYDMGYNVLAPAARAHWESEGDYISFGWYERYDYAAPGGWIAEAVRRGGPESEIVLHGTSMGAATMMLVSGETLPPNVKALVADCGYANLQDVVDNAMGHLESTLAKSGGVLEYPTHIGPLPYTATFRWVDMEELLRRLEADFNRDLALGDAPTGVFARIAPVQAVARSKIPILFIHGGADAIIPQSATLQQLTAAKEANAANATYSVYAPESAGHGASIKVDYAAYAGAIREFLAEAE